MTCRFGFMIAIVAALLAAPPAQAGGDVSGIWLTQAGDAKVHVSKCGGGVCGAVVWLRDPIDPATGKAPVDDKNHNPSLNKWSGQIYNADDGNSYASNISVAAPDSLRVEGCVGALCGGETWTRSAR